MELADLHNRRSNIGTVAKRCRDNNYPLLAWPEDKELLRLSDLPVINRRPNIPTTWLSCDTNIMFVLHSDQALRDIVKVGRAYYVRAGIDNILGSKVVEDKVTTL